MWNEQKRARFQVLRQREAAKTLLAAEQAELALLIEELEAGEAAYLDPATARLRGEREQLEAQNRAVQAVVSKHQS